MAGNNTRINILVEGQTEETFVRELLVPHLAAHKVWATAKCVRSSKGHKGGVVSYAKIRRQIEIWCKEDQTARVTSLFDIYGLPADFPGASCWNVHGDLPSQASAMEQALGSDVNQPNFLPYLQLHEYEALLFSDPNVFRDVGAPQRTVAQLVAIRRQFPTPESINNNPAFAPSKRIISVWPIYERAKPLYGVLAAIYIGLPKMRAECPRFNTWVTSLEQL